MKESIWDCSANGDSPKEHIFEFEQLDEKVALKSRLMPCSKGEAAAFLDYYRQNLEIRPRWKETIKSLSKCAILSNPNQAESIVVAEAAYSSGANSEGTNVFIVSLDTAQIPSGLIFSDFAMYGSNVAGICDLNKDGYAEVVVSIGMEGGMSTKVFSPVAPGSYKSTDYTSSCGD